jgi:hypothetical protein
MDHDGNYSKLLEVLSGERLPLDARSSKTLMFMLQRPEGCDVLLSPGRFEVRFGWHPARHRYDLDTAPRAVSYILKDAGVSDLKADFQAVIGPGTVASIDGFPGWSFGRRRLWIRRPGSDVAIMVRDAADVEGSVSSEAPLPEPIDFPPPTYLELPDRVDCPTCGATGSRFRELAGGALVCGECGCSFAANAAQPSGRRIPS